MKDNDAPPHISYGELVELASWGIFAMHYGKNSIRDIRYKELREKISGNLVENAYKKGLYTGSPGVDIYLMLPYLSDEEMENISKIIVNKFPVIPLGNHVNVSAFFRYLYGQKEKNGIFNSSAYFEKRRKQSIDLSYSRKFVRFLFEGLEKINNFYGLSVLCEMRAHRLGDEAIINKDLNKLNKMEEEYSQSVRYAHKCNSYKQMFTPYYWAFRYFQKLGDRDKALAYSYLMLKSASRYCPDVRPGYQTKVRHCVIYIKEKDAMGWKKFSKKILKANSTKCVKIIVKKFGKV